MSESNSHEVLEAGEQSPVEEPLAAQAPPDERREEPVEAPAQDPDPAPVEAPPEGPGQPPVEEPPPDPEQPADEEPAETAEAEQPELPGVQPSDDERLALLEAIIYVSEEPLTVEQICGGLALPREIVESDLTRLVEQYASAHRGVEVRKVAGGFKMYTKAEHHEAVRGFVRTLQPKLKLSKPAFETLAVIAYKQPITVPEIQAIRGVNASGTIHTLLKHKLITSAGRKKVIGKPMMYKTTREFLVQFGLDDLGELPNLKEFEELSRAALIDEAPEERPAADLEAAEEAVVDEGEEEEGDEA